GKSYAAKLEILRSLMLDTDVLVIDPENEYQYLAETVDGAFFKISLTSSHHINPFDLPPALPGEEAGDVLRSTIINLVGLLRIMLGGLTPDEEGILDHAINETYASRDITPETNFVGKPPPLMKDLQTVLESMEGGEGLAERLRRYTEGSYSGFVNNATNIDIAKKMVVFNVRDIEDELRPIAMYVVLHYIWNLIRASLKKRVLVVDEAWTLMKHAAGAEFLYGIAKRARKYYLGLTTITQDVTDFVSSEYGKAIVNNSSLQLLLRQHPAAIEVITDIFHLTDEEKFLLLETGVGQGIFFAGSQHVEIEVVASYTENQIITTDPAELLRIAHAKQEIARETSAALSPTPSPRA
ncbi:MAG: conjugal transfer protein TraC, partial [Parcubacteria group bacterium]|nr:conjugal transfer protein TraC [Parcubacteria group bacterium]